MIKRLLAGLITMGLLSTIYRNLSSEQSKGFWLGVLLTIFCEIVMGLLFVSAYLNKKANQRKLNINFGHDEAIEASSNLITQAEDDNQEFISDEQSEKQSETSSYTSQTSLQQIRKQPSLRTKIQQYRNRADMYFRKVKNNLFHDQKLPLCKLEKKQMLNRISALSNIMDLYAQHFTALSKAYQQIGEIGLLQKLSTELSQMEPYDALHAHYVEGMRLPHWNQIKKFFKSESLVQLEQKNYIQQSSQVHISNLQKEYLVRHAEMKKTKKLFQVRFAEACKQLTKFVQEQEETEAQIDELILQYKDLKRNRVEPAKQIKHEMKIKLAESLLPTQQHKVDDAKYKLKELEIEAAGINLNFVEFKEIWTQQFQQIAQGVIRSFLQNYFECIQEELTSINKLLVFEERQPSHFDILIDSEPTMDEDLMVQIRREKEHTIHIMNRCKQVDSLLNQIWRYDGEVAGLLTEIKESFRKCQQDDTYKAGLLAQPLMSCGLQWVIKSLIEKDGLMDFQQQYVRCFQSIVIVESEFLESKDSFQVSFKECEESMKEKVNQIVQMFNGILKDSEKISGISSFRESHKIKDSFQTNFQTYRTEQEQEKKRIQAYVIKCLELLENHEIAVSQVKFKVMALLISLNRELLKILKKAIKDFDQNFEEQLENENHIELKSPIPMLLTKKKSILQMGGRSIPFDAGAPEFQSEEKKPNRKHKEKDQISRIGKTETFLLGQLFKVFYLEWSKSLYFKEKFMEEMYLSLNKKRPDSLDEIIVTNVEIKGEPPEMILVRPQQCSASQFLFDFDISFRGQFILEFMTQIIINWPRPNYAQFPLSVKFIVKSLNGRVRVCYTPSFQGTSWFAFIGEPSMSIEIDPVVGKSQYNLSSLPSVSDIIREFLAFKIRRMTYPNKEKVRIPMAVGPPLISQKVKEQIRENILKWQSKQEDLPQVTQKSERSISK